MMKPSNFTRIPNNGVTPAGLKVCPACGAQNTNDAQFCSNCGRSLPGVPETGAPSVSLVPHYPVIATEDVPAETLRSVYMWIWWAVALFLVTTYELGVIGPLFVALFGGSEYTDLARDNPAEAQRLIDHMNQDQRLGSFATFIVATLLLTVISQLVTEFRLKARLNILLVCIIAIGLLSLLLDNLGVIQFPPLRPIALLVVIASFVVWGGPKVVQRVRSVFR